MLVSVFGCGCFVGVSVRVVEYFISEPASCTSCAVASLVSDS